MARLRRCAFALGLLCGAVGEHFQDDTLPQGVFDGAAAGDPSYADLAVRIDFSSLGGPGQELLGGIYLGETIAVESFATQFVLDLTKAIHVSPDRLFVLNVTDGDAHFGWRWRTTIVHFRLLEFQTPGSPPFPRVQPNVADAVRFLTDQAQTPSSMLFQGNVTSALDEHWGVVALDWDMSLRLMFSIEVVGAELVHTWDGEAEKGEYDRNDDKRTLDWGADRFCEEEAVESAYCQWERSFEEDISKTLGVSRGRVEVLFVRPAAPDSVLAHFRIFPAAAGVAEPSVSQATGDLLNQVSDPTSSLYSGNVTVRVDSAWGVSGVAGTARAASSRHLPYAARSNTSLPYHGYGAHSFWPDYERCKATQRCARGFTHYNASTATVYYTSQAYAGGEHVHAYLFAGFEDWRQGSFGWGVRGSMGWVHDAAFGNFSELNHPREASYYGVGDLRAPRGAHVSPFAFETVGPRVRTIDAWQWCHERQSCAPQWNDGLVLNAAQQSWDVELQSQLVEHVREDGDWIVENAETALLDADGARSRRDVFLLMEGRKDDVEAKLEHERRVLEALEVSQCSEPGRGCGLLFNTSSVLMTGTLNVSGEVVLTADGAEIAVFAFESISIGHEVNVTLVGQRALVLTSRSSVFINTTLKAAPGTLGGFPGGFSIARRPADRLADSPMDVPIGASDALSSEAPSNNVNGPGSPSTRIHLRTVSTAARDVDEVQRVSVGCDAGETLGGLFRLTFSPPSSPAFVYRTRDVSFDVTPGDFAKILEEDLNRLQVSDRFVAEARPGIGRVTVSQVFDGAVQDDGRDWLVTFTSAPGAQPLLKAESSLTGLGANAGVARVRKGNSLGGGFTLNFMNRTTRLVPHDSLPEDLAKVLVEDFYPQVVSAAVSRSDSHSNGECDDGLCASGPGPAGALTWFITLVTLKDNLTPPAPTAASALREPAVPLPILSAASFLTGINASMTARRGYWKSESDQLRGMNESVPASLSSFSLAFGGAGAAHGGRGGEPYGGYDGAGAVARASPEAWDTEVSNVTVGTSVGGGTTGGVGAAYGAADAGGFGAELYGGSGGAIGYSHPFVIERLGAATLPARGGAGGGAIEIVAMNDLELGAGCGIHVDAGDGFGGHLGGGGGGSGGTIVLAAGGVLKVDGFLTARGGHGGQAHAALRSAGDPALAVRQGGGGGGGGGGRVALYGRSLSTLSAWDPLRLRVDVSGGRCRELGDAFGCDGDLRRDGGSGSYHAEAAFELRYDAVIGDDVGGAFGTLGALRIRGRARAQTAATVTSESPLPFNGPEYEFADEPAQPARLSFFVRIDARSEAAPPEAFSGSWGAMLALFEAPASKSASDYTGGGSRGGATASGSADPHSTGFAPNSPLPPFSSAHGANVSVAFGLVLADRLTHGSGFRVSPGELEQGTAGLLGNAAGSAALLPKARQGRWYKIDVSFDWVAMTYAVWVDDVLRADDAPLKATGVSRVGLYAISDSGEARFDEIYLGPDHTMGFRCPVTTRAGVRFKTERPAVKGWSAEDLGGRTAQALMQRHDNHVSRREVYKHDFGGLVPFDGEGHTQFRSDVKQRRATDSKAEPGALNAGALLTLKKGVAGGGGASRRMTAAASAASKTKAFDVDHNDADFNRLSPLASDWRRRPRGEIDAAAYAGDYASFEAASRAHSSKGVETHFWYGEHDAPQGPSNVGDAAPPWLAGGVGACSSDDLVTWKREGVALHYANLTNMVHRRDAWQPGCGGYKTKHGTQDGYGCVGSLGLKAKRPRVLEAEARAVRLKHANHGFVMWMGVDDLNETYALAGCASAAHAAGPFSFRRTLYPDGNETRDMSLWRIGGGAATATPRDGAFALLGRTYYASIEYALPAAQMLPVWEMVRGANGERDFGLSFHRTSYQVEYDNYHDIYLQRWRLEDAPWHVVCVDRANSSNFYDVPRGSSRGSRGALCPDPGFYKIVLGQGHSEVEKRSVGVPSKFKDPRDSNNSFWRPDSVPAVRAQPWANNYVDGSCGFDSTDEDYDLNDPTIPFRERRDRGRCSNVADNPMHGTGPDELVGETAVTETRRAKFVAVSSLTADLLDTTGVLDAFEGELEGMDMDGLMQSYGQFDWSVGARQKAARWSTFESPVESAHFHSHKADVNRFSQYIREFNDRAFYSLACVIDGSCPVNFKDQAE
ncbi:hypothetical protein M885DRAFT_457457 [Pelagophyceae sp. CCMP2097]|nr:hypothetical protein M885DRAFT_457457 [Pelagophyceae sp. CCMP2097]